MNFSVVFEKVQEAGFPAGYYYAHIPSLSLTTHGLGIDGARTAAATGDKARTVGEIMVLFDAVIESSKAGVRKPDPRIYEMMCQLLDVAPGACVYLDDLGVNCKPAAAMGMAAIKVEGEDQALEALAAATGLVFD